MGNLGDGVALQSGLSEAGKSQRPETWPQGTWQALPPGQQVHSENGTTEVAWSFLKQTILHLLKISPCPSLSPSPNLC